MSKANYEKKYLVFYEKYPHAPKFLDGIEEDWEDRIYKTWEDYFGALTKFAEANDMDSERFLDEFTTIHEGVVKTKEVVIAELRILFGIAESVLSREHEGKFLIHKEEYLLGEMMEMLQDYFSINKLEDGYGAHVDDMTLVWSSFQIKELV